MTRYVIHIETDGDAFAPRAGPEVARILEELAEQVRRSGLPSSHPLRDINGNTVGLATLRPTLRDEADRPGPDDIRTVREVRDGSW